MSCICELSGEFSVVTRHQSVGVGSYIKYNSNGTISEQRDQARTVGTTVSIKNLFEVSFVTIINQSLASSSSSKSIYEEL